MNMLLHNRLPGHTLMHVMATSTIWILFVRKISCGFPIGTAAQEAIKIITHQFVPFNNTFIYNAMAQTSATFQL